MTLPADSSGEEKKERNPRRWLFRLLILFAGALVSLMVWNSVERSGLARRIVALRAEGAPAEPDDLNSPPIPDASNAAIELRAAAKIIDAKAETWKTANEMYPVRLPFTDKELTTLREAVAPNAAALPLVESAMQKRDVDWALKFRSPVLTTLLPDLNEQRDLANLLRFDALIAHQQGDDATAVRRIGQLLFLSKAVQRQPLIICHLVGIGISSMACDLAADIAPDLRIGGDSRSASEAQVRELIGQLLDESTIRDGLLRGLAGERVTGADTMKSMAEGRLQAQTYLPRIGPITLLKPLIYRNASASIEQMSAMIVVARETTTWPEFRTRFAAAPNPVKRSPRLNLIAALLTPSMERVVERYYRAVTDHRLTATALAATLYRSKNPGRFPTQLDDLVPEFLPAVPTDPFASPRKPLGYVADSARPRVYSVGNNGVDNGGYVIDDKKSRADNERLADIVIDLLRQPKPPEPEPDAE